MQETNAFAVAAALLNAVPEAVMAERREKVAKSLDNLIAWLPEPGSWTVVPDSGGAEAYLLAGDKVFRLSLKINRQSPEWSVEAKSRSLDDRVAMVFVKHDSPAHGRTATHWQIKFGDGTSLNPNGYLEDDNPHSAEKFARAVAAQLGWETQAPADTPS